MKIIFGNEIDDLKNKYVLLELDTFRINDNDPVTAYAVVETMNVLEIPQMERYITLHSKLLQNYRKKNWRFCEDAIEHLRNKWSGELTSFYQEIWDRVQQFKENDPGPDWDGIVNRCQ